jgi:hypothetical protein
MKADIAKPIAWTISVGVHVGIGILAFFITWSVIRNEEAPPHVVTSQWHELPVHEAVTLPMVTPELPSIEMELPPLPEIEQKKLSQDGFAVLHEIVSSGEIPKFATREPETEVQFMGLDAPAAKRIVYVVDASGSMLLHLSTVSEELERSLRALHPKQEFGIIFFQQDKAIAVPPKRSLRFASAIHISEAMEWINTSGKVIPSGGSNPIKALQSAMRLEPDVIYLLSENITGAGKYEIPPEELFASLNRINPVDSRNGIRKVQINCIQYLTQDPLKTMQKIAEIHGGEDGYTFIERGRVDR